MRPLLSLSLSIPMVSIALLACTEAHPFRKSDDIHTLLAQERAKHQEAIQRLESELRVLKTASVEVDALRVKKESLESRLAAAEEELATLRSRSEASAAVEEEIKRAKERAERLARERDEINEKFGKYALLENIGVDVTALGVRITVGDSLLFPSAQSTLNDGAREFLVTLADVLRKSDPREIRIVGHTDAQPLRASNQYRSNWELSSARAQSVLYALVERHKLSEAKFVVVGKGAHDPVASNDSPEGRAKNRRVEIYLIPNN